MSRSLTHRLALLTAAALLPAPLAFAAGTADEAPEPNPETLAPLHRSPDAIPGRYLVTLDTGFDPTAIAEGLGVDPDFVYRSAMLGFAASLTEEQVAAVRRLPGVAAVEQDAVVRADTQPAAAAAAPPAVWGLDRIDQRDLPLDSDFTTRNDGSGVTVFILDTGIDYRHQEFGGRAVPGFDAVGDGRDGADCAGHGTHVAGTVAGSTFGVAPAAKLVSVRVLDCEGKGSMGGIVAGLDWTARNAEGPAVLNGSLGGSYSLATNMATENLAASGVLPVVAAGNSDQDACRVSPASAPSAVTVGATRRDDAEAGFSNHGRCLDLYAPGQGIVSARLGGGSEALNGTSMASPHVAGVAALAKDEHGDVPSAVLARWLTDTSSTGKVGSLDAGSPNRLLYTGGL
ncbi:S8 family peptidase [Streptomyces sp. WMMC1477]|uniref:S8 family peptidase n=1 Tax=Streptomyces sp. WMMC1477 TaxID=3015155 RepID=UPI0022B6711D|nr:S8 family peptidase [Streptomyces sp. WMMC1477]MCZ7433586.1 S8 family peptidase [Streptomyces sp. WMMC1477]